MIPGAAVAGLVWAAWGLGDTDSELINCVGPVSAHGSVEEDTRVAVLDSGGFDAILGVNFVLFFLRVLWVLAELNRDSVAALP